MKFKNAKKTKVQCNTTIICEISNKAHQNFNRKNKIKLKVTQSSASQKVFMMQQYRKDYQPR